MNLLRAARSSMAMRRFLAASVLCGVVISGSTIASAVVLAHIVAGVLTEPASRSLAHWAGPLWILLALWALRTVAQWLQGRVSQRGATAVIEKSGDDEIMITFEQPQRAITPGQAAVFYDDNVVVGGGWIA